MFVCRESAVLARLAHFTVEPGYLLIATLTFQHPVTMQVGWIPAAVPKFRPCTQSASLPLWRRGRFRNAQANAPGVEFSQALVACSTGLLQPMIQDCRVRDGELALGKTVGDS